MFIKPNIYDTELYLKIKGLPFTELPTAFRELLLSVSFTKLHAAVITGNCLPVLLTPRLFVQGESFPASCSSRQNFFTLQEPRTLFQIAFFPFEWAELVNAISDNSICPQGHNFS